MFSTYVRSERASTVNFNPLESLIMSDKTLIARLQPNESHCDFTLDGARLQLMADDWTGCVAVYQFDEANPRDVGGGKPDWAVAQEIIGASTPELAFWGGYLRAVCFTARKEHVNEDGDPGVGDDLFSGRDDEEWQAHLETVVENLVDGDDLASLHESAMEFFTNAVAEGLLDVESDDLEAAGADFHLTRNGHGAGYLVGDWDQPRATLLREAAMFYGPCELTVISRVVTSVDIGG